ncbi:class I SAM-dependent methyltransferase [Pelagibius sp. 7325]|uniref:class I SAM-dependent methyltransferase n=1 Tax=Pelagibius sp. 7325 TaxID=3131994 RepID=UPI0030EE37AE
MSRRSIEMTDALYAYLLENSLRETDLLRRLREETAGLPGAGMQIAPEQGQFMALLAELIGARHCLEIGTFTGYSALAVALALPPDGRLIACDVNEKTTAVARRYWQEAGVAGKIDLRLAPALETLDTLLAEGAAGRFDFAFIDADKSNYEAYYERCLELLRDGGLIAVDNVLWGGAVTNPAPGDSDTRAIRALNAKIASDQRVSCSMLPLGDGLTLVRKRSAQAN